MDNIAFKRNGIPPETRLLWNIEGRQVKSFTVSRGGISIFCDQEHKLHISNKLKISDKIPNSSDAFIIDDAAEILMVNISAQEMSVDIIYKDSDGCINSYRFYDDDITVFSRYKNIFSFKTDMLNDHGRTQLDFSYDSEYFCPMHQVDEDGKRNKYGYYYTDYPCTTFGRKVLFDIKEDSIHVHGIGHFDHFLLMTEEAYGCLSDFDRLMLHRFVKTAEAYINNLYVNRDNDYEMVLNGDENTEVQAAIDKLSDALIKDGWRKKCYFSDGEQGHPAGNEVYIYDKDGVRFVWYWQIEFYGSGDYVTIKCDEQVLNCIMRYIGDDLRFTIS